MLKVRVDGLEFRGFDDGNQRGYWIKAGGWEGWDDSVDAHTDTADRPQADGQFDSDQFLTGRTVRMAGFFASESLIELDHMARRLRGMLHGQSKRKLVVEGAGGVEWATVRRGLERPTVDIGGNPQGAELFVGEFEMFFRAPDPFKYGDPITAGPAQSVEFVNRGNQPAVPTLTVTGASPGGYTVSGPDGRQVVVTRALQAGIPHRFDTRLARLYVGGAHVLGGVSKADFFDLPMGASNVSVSNGLSLTVTADTRSL